MVPEVSIVSGTYNRLKYLGAMVESARLSIGVGVPYEFVLVDGGSNDGTLEWCKAQGDVVLIEHGSLRGAVKAFNDGAKAASGRYVILANDDIQFINESILSALCYMQDHPEVGVGCFYQDRRGWDFHVEEMSAVQNGKQISVPYGQVCIVPKWLGDQVGWWGDYLRTYGGDNELSCNVLQAGYKTAPIPCACIHDLTPADNLRTVNNLFPGKVHPDTQKWLDKWTNKQTGTLGPVLPEVKKLDEINKRYLRILYAPIYEPGHMLQRRTKRGLRHALQRVGLVAECDYVGQSVDYVFDLGHAFNPDIFLLQVHSLGNFKLETINELRTEFPRAKFVNWNGDYHPEHLYDKEYMRFLKRFHLTGLVTTEVRSRYDQAGIPWFYWQIGYEYSASTPDTGTHHHDLLFLANGYSEARKALAHHLRLKFGSRLGLYGSWSSDFKPNGNTLYDFDRGARLYRACKIALSDSQWPSATGFVSNRLFQAMSAGAFLLQQEFDGLESLLGLRDGIHLVTWKDEHDLVEKANYYLSHEEERKEIAKTGMNCVLEKHSFNSRVKELIHALAL